MHATSTDRDASFSDIARTKLVKVLGPARGQRVYQETLREMDVTALESADELHAFGEQLGKRGGIESAVGAMLGVAAVVRGASGRRTHDKEETT